MLQRPCLLSSRDIKHQPRVARESLSYVNIVDRLLFDSIDEQSDKLEICLIVELFVVGDTIVQAVELAVVHLDRDVI